ncbi:MAG: ornithine cyclodeaminase family protein [Ktedonobacteraceae bacterium]
MALILSRADAQRCLTMRDAIEAMNVAFGALRDGLALVPQRAAVPLAEQGVALLMPSLIQTSQEHAFGLKVVTVMPRNPQGGLSRIYATVLLLDDTTGRALAIMEGGWLTAMRTGAASGLATALLARQDAAILTVFGAGAQAPMQIVAAHTARPLREVRVVNRDMLHYHALVETVQHMLGNDCPPLQHFSLESSREALSGASLVACATTATTPLFEWRDIAPGTHINAVGAFTPEMCEIDAETLAHARIVVDQRESAMAEAGDLLQALAAGRISGSETWSELGEIVRGARPARQSAEEITVFKSVGNAVQDVAVALRVYNRARYLGLGVEVDV